MSEPWLDKKGVAAHYACSVRYIEYRMAEGMPHRYMAGKAIFRLSETDPWLGDHGHIERPMPPGCTVVTGSYKWPPRRANVRGPGHEEHPSCQQ